MQTLLQFTRVSDLTAIMLSVLLLSCAREVPLVDEETYVALLTELELIYVIDKHVGDEYITQRMIDTLWTTYNVSKEAFQQSHAIYQRDLDNQLIRLKTIETNLENLHNRLNTEVSARREEAVIRAQQTELDAMEIDE
jgi:hypothetical protein